jgi:hypothetical protein
MHSTYNVTWKIESTSYEKAKQSFENKRIMKINQWIDMQWYNFYTEKYGEDFLK